MQEWMDDTIIHNLTKEEKKRFQNYVVHFIFHVHPFFFFFTLFFITSVYNSKLLQMLISLIFGECVCEMMCVRGRDDYFILKQNILVKRLHTSSSNKENKKRK